MNGSGLLLEVTAPGNVNALDRFVARTRESAAAWATWALEAGLLERFDTLGWRGLSRG